MCGPCSLFDEISDGPLTYLVVPNLYSESIIVLHLCICFHVYYTEKCCQPTKIRDGKVAGGDQGSTG